MWVKSWSMTRNRSQSVAIGRNRSRGSSRFNISKPPVLLIPDKAAREIFTHGLADNGPP